MRYDNGKIKLLLKKKDKKASKYKYVLTIAPINGVGPLTYRLNFAGLTKKTYLIEREAALAVDMHLISKNKKPVNILKKL